jgi:hypothetical protein
VEAYQWWTVAGIAPVSAELYIDARGNLAKTGNTLIVPSNLSAVATLVSSAMTIVSGAQRREAPKPALGLGAGKS